MIAPFVATAESESDVRKVVAQHMKTTTSVCGEVGAELTGGGGGAVRDWCAAVVALKGRSRQEGWERGKGRVWQK